jgi:flagellar biosynthesis/type III secretory pathway protein FliH
VQDANGLDFSIGRVEIVADASLKTGDVVVETEHHTVDGRIDTRLDELRRELLTTLEG